MGKPAHIGNPHGYPDYTWPMVWVLQDAELWPIEQWAAHVGVHKVWHVSWSQAAAGETSQGLYTVPAGKLVYVIHYISASDQPGVHRLVWTPPDTRPFEGPVAASNPIVIPWAPPLTVSAGKTIYVSILNRGSVTANDYVTVLAFELDA